MAPGGVVMTVHGWTGVLAEEADGLGVRTATFEERPEDHFYGGRTIAWMRLPEKA
jgi:hypothetical protein